MNKSLVDTSNETATLIFRAQSVKYLQSFIPNPIIDRQSLEKLHLDSCPPLNFHFFFEGLTLIPQVSRLYC